MRIKGTKQFNDREYKARTDWLSAILFLILTITAGYTIFSIIAHFYLKGVENALYEVPARTCLAAGDLDLGSEEYPIIYMGENSVMGVLIPLVETAEINEPLNNEQLKRIIWCESRENPTAKNPDSSAYGYCQIIDATWNYIQKKWDMKLDRHNPSDQLYACERLLSEEGTVHWKSSYNCWSSF